MEHGSTCSRPKADDTAHPPRPDGSSRDPLAVRVGSLEGEPGFFVADDGPGIPPETRERAFDPGFTTVADGTGLGLSIVHRIFEAHGWSVEVTEGEAGGARFVVRGVTPVVRADQ